MKDTRLDLKLENTTGLQGHLGYTLGESSKVIYVAGCLMQLCYLFEVSLRKYAFMVVLSGP